MPPRGRRPVSWPGQLAFFLAAVFTAVDFDAVFFAVLFLAAVFRAGLSGSRPSLAVSALEDEDEDEDDFDTGSPRDALALSTERWSASRRSTTSPDPSLA